MLGIIIIAVLAAGFVVLLWVKSAGPGNDGAALGHNSPYPDAVFGPSVLRPPLGSPESLESHADLEWVDRELERSEHRRHPGGPPGGGS
jgi:hypothetical protein